MDASHAHAHFSLAERQRWMATLAHSQPDDLESIVGCHALSPRGMEKHPLSRNRVGPDSGSCGSPRPAIFLGDATLTRAVIQLVCGTYGYSYLLGRDKLHAERCALIDALLQKREHAPHLLENLINPLAALQQERHQQRAQEIAASRVDFFTLVRGDN